MAPDQHFLSAVKRDGAHSLVVALVLHSRWPLFECVVSGPHQLKLGSLVENCESQSLIGLVLLIVSHLVKLGFKRSEVFASIDVTNSKHVWVDLLDLFEDVWLSLSPRQI